MISYKRGFSFIELLIVIIISTIVVLMMAAMLNIAYKSYKDLRNQSNVYNDSQYALQLIRENVRQSTSAPTYSSNCLTITANSSTKIFYINGINLVYSTTCGSSTNTPIIKGVSNLTFTPTISGSLVKIVLNGTKNNINFNYSLSATRRNP